MFYAAQCEAEPRNNDLDELLPVQDHLTLLQLYIDNPRNITT